MLSNNPTGQEIEKHVQDALTNREYKNQISLSPIASHSHTGTDASQINQNDVVNGPKGMSKQYYAREHDNGSVATTATINWANGNVQYVTLTGNTTFTFTNAQSGMRAILHIAGAFTPTLPSTVRYSGGTTPSWTASAGKKDILSVIYSGKENLYDIAVNFNFATT